MKVIIDSIKILPTNRIIVSYIVINKFTRTKNIEIPFIDSINEIKGGIETIEKYTSDDLINSIDDKTIIIEEIKVLLNKLIK